MDAPTKEQQFLLDRGLNDRSLGTISKTPSGGVVVDGECAYASDVMRAWARQEGKKILQSAPPTNKAIPKCLCKSCGKELASYLIDDNTFKVEIEHECSHSDTSA